ncbi:MAG: hypothetical protein CMK32_16500 [Porticoccaceae bacterium]|nr:hypothetical protein [Porticoccaceae bacterium]
MYRHIAVVLLTLLITGCASLDRDECLSADWYSLGREDGSSGASAERLDRHREDCAEYGITPDRAAYEEGYERGIDDFCTAASGYEKGRRGHHYNGVCPAALESGFLLGYQQGYALHQAEQRVEAYNDAIETRAREIANSEYRIYHLQEILADGDSSDAERQQALVNIRYLQRNIQSLRFQLLDLRHQRQDAVMEFQRLDGQHFQGWPASP